MRAMPTLPRRRAVCTRVGDACRPDGRGSRWLAGVAAYGLPRLREAGEYRQVLRRHRQFYSDLAERAATRLRGYDQRSWLRCLDAEAANMHAALGSATRDGDTAALRMANALAWYWLLSGQLAQARRTLGEALALPGGSASERATALAWPSGFATLAGEPPGHAAPPLDDIDDPGTRALLQWFHAFVASDFGDPSAAEAMLGDATASFRAAGDQWGIAAALGTRAQLAMIRGDNAATPRLPPAAPALVPGPGGPRGQRPAAQCARAP